MIEVSSNCWRLLVIVNAFKFRFEFRFIWGVFSSDSTWSRFFNWLIWRFRRLTFVLIKSSISRALIFLGFYPVYFFSDILLTALSITISGLEVCETSWNPSTWVLFLTRAGALPIFAGTISGNILLLLSYLATGDPKIVECTYSVINLSCAEKSFAVSFCRLAKNSAISIKNLLTEFDFWGIARPGSYPLVAEFLFT